MRLDEPMRTEFKREVINAAGFPTVDLSVQGLRCIALPTVVGAAFSQMPVVHRILLENILRCQNAEIAKTAIRQFTNWLKSGHSDEEIEFLPNRILMHDTTCGPALVDIAAMRDAVAAAGVDPRLLDATLPVATSSDHSIAVDSYARRDSLAINIACEIERNRERYRFVKWAAQTISGFRVFPPGSGIMHTINMERLATVSAQGPSGGDLCFPDTLVGTDSHTPMVNSMGVLAWGVGGIEAEGVMFGIPVTLRLPDVIGVRLTGSLSEGVLATDLALKVTHELRLIGVSGEFVEFFGPGVSTLTVGQRSAVANMAPEYGATTGFFPVDANTVEYLRLTGRAPAQIELVEGQAKAQGVWFDPLAELHYSSVVEIDLTGLRPTVAGPKRPQDTLPTADVPKILRPELEQTQPGRLPPDALAIAAITSCTNTTDLGLLVAAGLVARNARERGLSPPSWVKTSLTPGSPATARRLRRAGLLEDLEALGFAIAAYGCATCIGNSGSLSGEIERAIGSQGLRPVAVFSGNRNFPGRVHNKIDNAFLASPPLVVAYALAGRAAVDIATTALGRDKHGHEVTLKDIWPSSAEVEQVSAQAWATDDVAEAYRAAEASPFWAGLEGPRTSLFPWDEGSTYLRPPPFVQLEPPQPAGQLELHPIMVVGDDVTTDHISPAGSIPGDSDAGRWLVEHGENPAELNVYSSRRGNWEVMVRGLFTNHNVENLVAPGLKPGTSILPGETSAESLWKVSARHRSAGNTLAIVAGDRYGTGSSRDWAAKGPALLGVRVLFARSIERIHRSNLIGMGVLPLCLPVHWHPTKLALRPGDVIEIEWAPEAWAPQVEIATKIRRLNRTVEAAYCRAFIETQSEADLLRSGGLIPKIVSETIARCTGGG